MFLPLTYFSFAIQTLIDYDYADCAMFIFLAVRFLMITIYIIILAYQQLKYKFWLRWLRIVASTTLVNIYTYEIHYEIALMKHSSLSVKSFTVARP